MKKSIVAAGMMILLLPGYGAARQLRYTGQDNPLPVQTDTAVHKRQFHIRENDTSSYTLQLALDAAGRPLYFFRNIFTPVCLTGECRPVYINFYWDLLGNYTRYDLPPGEVLTKADHRAFKKEDYEKLQEILSNTNSLFADLQMEELIAPGTEQLADSVDGKTGATIKTIKNEVIEGAVYTCYTLWHIAHGKAQEQMRRITEGYSDEQLLHSFLAGNNHHYQYWAMERVIDSNGNVQTPFEQDILQVIRGKNIFTARHALQKVKGAFFAGDTRQSWLWQTYLAGGYPLQAAILKKLDEIPLTGRTVTELCRSMGSSNREQFNAKLALLAKQPQLPPEAQQHLAALLSEGDAGRAAEIYKVLKKFQPASADISKKISAYANSHQQKDN